MLAPRGSARAPVPPRRVADPVAGVSVVLLTLLALGLLTAAIMATYGYTLPAVEAPTVAALAAVFGLILALNLAALGARRWRRGRR